MKLNIGMAAFALTVSLGGPAWPQGSLTPPGAPGPVMKTLDQVAQQAEPRRAITNLPYTISVPGSYYLISNLTGVAASEGIRIATNDVTLDLNGFELLGLPTSYSGIYVFPAYQNNITVRNGSLRNWGRQAIDAENAQNSLFLGIRAYSNDVSQILGRPALSVGLNSVVRDCVARGNCREGISALIGCEVRDCVAAENGGNGIECNFGCTIRDCSASGNQLDGIYAYSACTIVGCLVRGNTAHGIEVYQNNLVTHNLCDTNGASATVGAGIYISSTGNRIDENTATGNDYGFNVSSSGNLVVRNSARGNATNYVGTTYGVANVLSVGGAMSFTDAQPWANFSF